MKKLLLTSAAAAVVLSTGIGFGEKAEAATKIKETKLNYLSQATAKKIKAGKITSLDGMKLDTPKSKYLSNTQYDISESWTDMRLSNVYSYNRAYFDFNGGEASSVITRLVDSVENDYNAEKLTLTTLRNIYGTPKSGYSIVTYTDKYKRSKENRADIYKNYTFFYEYKWDYSKDKQVAYLTDVVYHGKKIKNNLNKWRYFIKVDQKYNMYNTPSNLIDYDAWTYYYDVK